MSEYLKYMDELKQSYTEKLATKLKKNAGLASRFYFYKKIEFIVEKDILFRYDLFAVKSQKIAIIFWKSQVGLRVYFSDNEIKEILANISEPKLKKHIKDHLQMILSDNETHSVRFKIMKKEFNIKGIPFNVEFNDATCMNCAGIDINGNDLIAFLNLVIEKERSRKPKEFVKTIKRYLSIESLE